MMNRKTLVLLAVLDMLWLSCADTFELREAGDDDILNKLSNLISIERLLHSGMFLSFIEL